MRRWLARFTAVVVTMQLFCAVSAGQLIVVRPGFVKAPFVRVYSNPDGSSYVRAPFVGVHSPPRWAPPPYAIVQPAPTPADLSAADWRTLRQLVRNSAAELHHALAGIRTGATWQRYLALPQELLESSDQRIDAAEVPRPTELTKLKELATRLDSVSRTHEYRMIAALPEFQRMQRRLTAYIASLGDPILLPPAQAIEALPPPKPESP